MNSTKIIKLVLIKALLLTTTIANASVELYFDSPVQSGNLVNVGILISGLGNEVAPSLSTYDLDIQFDANHLAYSGIVFGDSILGNQLDIFGFGDNETAVGLSSSGVLNIFELSFDSPEDLYAFQADSFTLAMLTFSVLAANTSQLNIAVNALGDAEGHFMVANLSSGKISTVPLPSSLWLMVAALTFLSRPFLQPANQAGDVER